MLTLKVNKTQKIVLIFGMFVVFLIGRILFAKYNYFQETDDMAIATGIASLVRNNIGDTYRYGPQMGYYRLVEMIDLALGGNVMHIPMIMVTLSAVAGALIPICSFFAFRKELKFSDRMILALFLYVNPVLWMSSRYGNTAIVALLFALVSIVLLSNLPRRGLEFIALALLGCGILIRADTVLLIPIVTVFIYFNHKSVKSVIIRGVVFGMAMLVIYALVLSFDPHMDNIHSTTTTHLLNPRFYTKFWYYLIWSFSPFPLLFAAWGMRDLLAENRKLFLCVFVWCFPVFLFYFGSTTTPRYFLLTVFPLLLCSVIGLKTLAEILIKKHQLRMHFVWGGLFIPCFIHLFIGLGHFKPDRISNIFKNAFIETHDGRLYTGGFLYHADGAILKQSLKKRSFQFPTFAKESVFSNAVQTALQNIASNWSLSHTLIVLLDGWNGHEFHLHAQAAGAEYLSRKPGRPDLAFSTETWFMLGNVKVMTIAIWSEDYAALDQLKVEMGDEIWDLGTSMEKTIYDKLPHGLDIIPLPSPANRIRAFKIVKAQN